MNLILEKLREEQMNHVIVKWYVTVKNLNNCFIYGNYLVKIANQIEN